MKISITCLLTETGGKVPFFATEVVGYTFPIVTEELTRLELTEALEVLRFRFVDIDEDGGVSVIVTPIINMSPWGVSVRNNNLEGHMILLRVPQIESPGDARLYATLHAEEIVASVKNSIRILTKSTVEGLSRILNRIGERKEY